MLKHLAKKTARVIAPHWAKRIELMLWTKKQAQMLRKQYYDTDLEKVVEALRISRVFPANQKREEILSLLHAVRDLRPQRICEIGSAWGGTLFLLCQVAPAHARILSIDSNHQWFQKAVFPSFCRASQRMTCMSADSHSAQTRDAVVNWLRGSTLDFLFIDGDHTWQGVKSDFDMYAPLVRPGGIIAFHDIVPDFRTRFGTLTASDVGQVPQYWRELKTRVGQYQEYIEDLNQDGYGIGVVHWDPVNFSRQQMPNDNF